VDSSQTVAHGPGLEEANTSEPARFVVETRTASGKRYTKGNAPIDVWVVDQNGNELPVTKVDKGDGTFDCSYEPKDVGEATVNVVVRNKAAPSLYSHIAKSAFRVPVVPGTDAAHSVAFGPGLGDKVYDTLPTSFTIQAKDRHGRNVPTGGDPFEVKIVGPHGPVESTLTDNGDGTYSVAYAPTDSGKHSVQVALKGQRIKDAPFTVVVREGADHSHSKIETYQFTIRALSKKGVYKTEGGDNFSVEITAPSGEESRPAVRDSNDGSYHVSYSLSGPGKHSIAVKLNGHDIVGSPFVQGFDG